MTPDEQIKQSLQRVENARREHKELCEKLFEEAYDELDKYKYFVDIETETPFEPEEPLLVREILNVDEGESPYDTRNRGKLVKVRPCNEDKTYLGIHLGELPGGGISTHFREGILGIESSRNPTIYIPETNRLVRGYECWWGVITDPSELKEISDETIQDVWYVKLLNSLASKDGSE